MPGACGTASIITTARISLNVHRAFSFYDRKNSYDGKKVGHEHSRLLVRKNACCWNGTRKIGVKSAAEFSDCEALHELH
jgi:hypothetical protein